jgi:hypothetical protein
MEPKVLSSNACQPKDRSRRLPWLPAIALVVAALIALLAVGGSAGAQSGPEGVDAVLWAQNFCLTGTQCLTGDFDGDGLDDIIQLNHQVSPQGAVYVAKSNGSSFGASEQWNSYFCVGNGDICKIGDFNGDGKDDIAAFVLGAGTVYVSLSNGSSFVEPNALPWKSTFSAVGEIPDVGDYNGDGATDIATFLRSNYDDKIGWVYVALSNYDIDNPSRSPTFGTSQKWASYFCVDQEICGSGDFNGDGRDDIVTFRPYQNTGDPYAAPVFVATSNGYTFVKTSSPWKSLFCGGTEICGVGDFNGDGKDDVITYLRSSYAGDDPPKIGYNYVAVSNGTSFPASTLWNWSSSEPFCVAEEQCGSGRYLFQVNQTNYSQVARTGDFNGDGHDDVVTFLQSDYLPQKPGYVYVKLAWGNHFTDSIPTGVAPAIWVPIARR